MYSVTKRINFCYGHRLLDYDGPCKHPHGHNAVAEVEVRTGTLDKRNMVCDFSEIKNVVKKWIDEDKAGRPWFMAQRKKEQAHQIEEVGTKLRTMMPFLDAVTLKESV